MKQKIIPTLKDLNRKIILKLINVNFNFVKLCFIRKQWYKTKNIHFIKLKISYTEPMNFKKKT